MRTIRMGKSVLRRQNRFRRLILEALESRLAMHGPGPDHDFGATIEVQTDSGFRPLDGALVTVDNPVVRIKLDGELIGKNVRVLLDDTDPLTPMTNISEQFPALATTGEGMSLLELGKGTYTIEVHQRGHLDSATMIVVGSELSSFSSPRTKRFVRDSVTNVKYEKDMLILNFSDDVSLDVISSYLQAQRLRPLDINMPFRMVRVEIQEDVSPLELGEYLTSLNTPFLEGILPNVLLETDMEVAAERLPKKLLDTYHTSPMDGGFSNANFSVLTNELLGARYHYIMDTFAGHELVRSLVGDTPSLKATLAIVDTGFGNGKSPNPTDIADSSIDLPAGVTWSTIVDQGGHGTSVAAAAAGRGDKSLGTGPDIRIKPVKAGKTVDEDFFPDLSSVASALSSLVTDASVSVINLSLGTELNRDIPTWLTSQIDVNYNSIARSVASRGKILVTSAGNKGRDTTVRQHFPSDLAPGPGPRTAADPLIMSVGSSTTINEVEGPEALAHKSNFGSRISVVAPGERVVLQGLTGDLAARDGTSFAAPAVAGLASEMIYTDLNIDKVRSLSQLNIVELIEATADDLGSSISSKGSQKPNDRPNNNRDDIFGHGRINVWKSILGVANGGIAADKVTTGSGGKPTKEFPSLTVVNENVTNWYGFKIRTNQLHATVWLDGEPLTDSDASVPRPGDSSTQVSAYAGVRPHMASVSGGHIVDPGTVPIGNNGGEYLATFSIKKADLVRADGKPKTLSLRLKGQTHDDRPYFNLPLNLTAMRAGQIPGVTFDDFVFEISPNDFGDAPDDTSKVDDYPTQLMLDSTKGAVTVEGARHLNSNFEWLGATVSNEINSNDESDIDGIPNADFSKGITFTDLDGGDDGVIFFPLSYRPGAVDGKTQFTVTVADRLVGQRIIPDGFTGGRYGESNDRSLYLNAWIDWDGDAKFEETNDEHIIDGLKINPASSDFAPLTQKIGPTKTTTITRITRPERGRIGNSVQFEATHKVGSIAQGKIYARFRLDYGENAGRNDPAPMYIRNPALELAKGPARFGEVEDYAISVDFGDAKDPFAGAKGSYPTLRDPDASKDGARHLDTTKEWFGDGVTREFDAGPDPTRKILTSIMPGDEDPTPNLGFDGKADDLDLGDDSRVTYNGLTKELSVAFTVNSTIESRGYDNFYKDHPITTLGSDGKPTTVKLSGETPSVSRGLGRYNGLLEPKKIFVNIWADWNGNGSWDDASEQVLVNAAVAPETFGKDGKYTLGDGFEDKNHNGVYDKGVDGFVAAIHDFAGTPSKDFRIKFKAPDEIEVATKFAVRMRLTYGEAIPLTVINVGTLSVASADERDKTTTDRKRTLYGTRGSALFGEVEDHVIASGSIKGQKWQDFFVNGIHDAKEPGLDDWMISLFRLFGDRLEYLSSQSTKTIDLNGNGKPDAEVESGLYSFDDLPPGIYVVAEGVKETWTQMYPNKDTPSQFPMMGTKLPGVGIVGPFGHRIALGTGEKVVGRDFGNAPPGVSPPKPPSGQTFAAIPSSFSSPSPASSVSAIGSFEPLRIKPVVTPIVINEPAETQVADPAITVSVAPWSARTYIHKSARIPLPSIVRDELPVFDDLDELIDMLAQDIPRR